MATPGPSLPPSVDGRVRACLHLSVKGLAWTRQYPGRGRDGFVRAKWWGQTDGGTVIKPPVAGVPYSPNIGRAGDVSFPVRCPLKRLVHYLGDARHLVLDVVDAKTQRTVGRAKVPFRVATATVGAVLSEGEIDVQDASLRTIGTLSVALTLEPPPAAAASRSQMPGFDAADGGEEDLRKSDEQYLLDAGLESTAAFVANEMLAQAGLGGGSADMGGILRASGERQAPFARPRTAGELHSPIGPPPRKPPASANGGAGGNKRGGGGARRTPTVADDGLRAVLNRAAQLRDRIAQAAESGVAEAALPPASWTQRGGSSAGTAAQPLVSSLAPTWGAAAAGPQSAGWSPTTQLFNAVDNPAEARPFPPQIEGMLRSIRSLRLFAGQLELASRGSSAASGSAPFYYLSCQFPAWFTPNEACVAGTLAPHGAAIDFACNATVSIGGARAGKTAAGAGGGMGPEWWALAKLVFVVRGVTPTSSSHYSGASVGGPADEVFGVGFIALRDVVEAPNCRLECNLEMRARHAMDPLLGTLTVATELREDSVPVLARR